MPLPNPPPNPYPLVWREFDARHFNAIVNDPAIREHVADMAEGVLDLGPVIENRENVLLAGEHGACLFLRTLPGSFEVHSQILRSGRGRWAFDFAKQAVTWMFTNTDACDITTRIPKPHGGARMLAIKTGMRHDFERFDGCRFHGEVVPVDVYSFRVQDWIKTAPGLEEIGADFHERLHAAVELSGHVGEAHAPDANHDRYLGAAIQMVRSGQVGKGASIYNSWAISARHATVTLLQISPPVIRFDAGDLTFLGDDIVVRKSQ